MTRVNIHMYPSDFMHESRMLRETNSIRKLGVFDDIVIVAIWRRGLQKHEKLDDGREVWRVPLYASALPNWTPFKIIKHGEWILRILLRFRNEPVTMINCHNLSSLLAGTLLRMLTRRILVYDTHELETERSGWSRTRRWIARASEGVMIRRVDLVIAVNESIAGWYRKKYSIPNVCAVYNFPHFGPTIDSDESCDLKKRFNIGSHEMLFIYQGVLDVGRGVDLLLDVFSSVSADKHLVCMGYGPLEGKAAEFSQHFGNIHFQPAVGPEDVVSYVRSADVGFYLIENTSLSYYLSLGNKFAECIVAGLPVISVDYPETARLIDAYGCGWKVALDRNAVSDLIRRLSLEEVSVKKRNVLLCQDQFKWKNEEAKMLKAYEDVFASCPSCGMTMQDLER